MLKTFYKSEGVYLDAIPFKDRGICLKKDIDKEEWYIWDFTRDTVTIPYKVYKLIIPDNNIYSLPFYIWNKFNINLYLPDYIEFPLVLYKDYTKSPVEHRLASLDYRFSKLPHSSACRISAILKHTYMDFESFWDSLNREVQEDGRVQLLTKTGGINKERNKVLIDYFKHNSQYFNWVERYPTDNNSFSKSRYGKSRLSAYMREGVLTRQVINGELHFDYL